MKKAFYGIVLIMLLVLSLAACNGGECEHSYTESVTTQPTCSAEGVKTFTCSLCQDSYTEKIEKLAHSYTDTVTAPTCTEKGYTTHTCACGSSYTDTEVAKLEHSYSEALKSNATHHYYECSCGAKRDEAAHISSGAATATADEVCTVCGYVIKNAVGISFKTLTVNGTNVYGKVSNSTEVFSFKDEIHTAGGAKFTVALDLYGMQSVATKTVSLNAGDNTFYVIETIDNELAAVYTVTIRRLPKYSVSFNENGGTPVANQTIEEGSLATEPVAPARAGYTFTGWDYDFTSPITQNTTVSAKWTANTNTVYKVEYYLEKLDGTYELKETENLAGTTDTTATAVYDVPEGFYLNEYKSNISGNIAGNGSLVLKVYYTRDSYTVTTSINNSLAGTVTAGGTYKYGTEITLTATINPGYTFLGFAGGETSLSTELTYTFVVDKNIDIVATANTNGNTPYKVEHYLEKLDGTYEFKETENLAGTTDTTATAVYDVPEGFYLNEYKSNISGNIAGNGSLVLKVYYTRDSYTVTTSINNSLAGSITAGGVYKYGTEITVRVSVNQGYTYNGIFSGVEKRCEGTEYTFTVSENIALTAEAIANTDTPYTVKYYKQNSTGGYDLIGTKNLVGITDTVATAEYEVPEGFYLHEYKSNISGNIAGDGSLVLVVYYSGYERDGNYIYFGEYPQTLKADSVTITETQDTRGYYLGSDGFYYAKVVADPYDSSYKFSTGATVTDGATYYFKVEPIRWRILSEDGETALILCDSILENMEYDYLINNYANSKIRQWLNATFYETAFTELQREMILTTTVDNSAASTGYSSNPYACDDTEDKIFLLSYKEATNSAYGFSTSSSTEDEARRMQTSDYYRATGAWMSTGSGYYGNGYWWLRSPDNDYKYSARGVVIDGDVGYYFVDKYYYGVVPALQIRL